MAPPAATMTPLIPAFPVGTASFFEVFVDPWDFEAPPAEGVSADPGLPLLVLGVVFAVVALVAILAVAPVALPRAR